MINYMTAQAATVQTSSNTITITAEYVDFSKIDENYVVLLDNGLYVMPVTAGTAPDGSGNSTLTLVDTWEGAPLTNKKLLVLPVFAKIYETVTAMTALNDVTRGILGKLNDVLTSTDATVNIPIGVTSSVDVTPVGYMANQIQSYVSDLNAELNTITENTRNEVNIPLSKNKVIYDDQGNANVMVWINKFNSEDVNAAILARHGIDMQLGTGVFPAFIKNGVQMRGFWYAKYAASPAPGGCSVVHSALPYINVNYDTAKSLCTNKGAGWHLSSNLEWMAIAYLNLAYCDEQPRGDTNYGRAHNAKHETSKRASATHAPGDTAHSAASLCGTGPNTWSHDGTEFGVFDMVGNVWEWVDQFKLSEGRVYAPADNNPDLVEASWPAQDCYFDSSGTNSGSVVLNSTITNRTGDIGDNGSGNGVNSNVWAATTKSGTYVSDVLIRQMGVEPVPTANFKGNLYSRNFGERLPIRGGAWDNGGNAGLGALNLYHVSTVASSSIGFRPAYFES